MDRGSTPAFQTEIAKAQNQPVHLVEVELDSGTVYMTDAYRTITYDGNDYLKLGHFLSFSDIEEAAEVIVSSMTISLSAVDQTWVSTFLQNDYIDRVVKVYTAFLDSNQALIVDPVLIFEGRIDSPVINEDPEAGTSSIAVSVTNAWIDFSRKTGRHTNHEEQQVFFAGDMGFEFASEIVKDVIWGRK